MENIKFLNFVYRPLSRTWHRNCISFRPQVKRWKAPYLFVSFLPEDDIIKVETCRPDNILFLLYIKWSVVLLTDMLYLYNISGWKALNFWTFVYRPLSRTWHRNCISFRPQVKRWKVSCLFVSFLQSWSSSFYNIRHEYKSGSSRVSHSYLWTKTDQRRLHSSRTTTLWKIPITPVRHCVIHVLKTH